MTSNSSVLLVCNNKGKSGFSLKNQSNGKAYLSKHHCNRRNQTLGFFITDEIRSSHERRQLFLKYLSTTMNHEKKYGFMGLIVGGKPFYDRTIEYVQKITPIILSNNWCLDGGLMNEDTLFKIAKATGIAIYENWNSQGEGNWSSANSFTVEYFS